MGFNVAMLTPLGVDLVMVLKASGLNAFKGKPVTVGLATLGVAAGIALPVLVWFTPGLWPNVALLALPALVFAWLAEGCGEVVAMLRL